VLQTPLWAMRGPALWLGCAATTIPFASLWHREPVTGARRKTHDASGSWTLGAWVLLGVAVMVDVRLAYAAAEGHARWIRTALSSSSMLPWLAASFALHLSGARGNRAPVLRVLSIWGMFASAMLAVAMSALGTRSLSTGLAVFSRPWSWLLLAPALIALVLLGLRPSAFAPRAAVIEAARSERSRLGGRLVHAGVALLCIALIGARFSRDADVSLVAGADTEVRDALGQRWRFVSEGVYDLDQFNRRIRGVGIQAWRGASRVGHMKTERRQFIDRFGNPIDDPVVVAGLLNTTAEGVHVVLSGDHEDEDHVEVRITFDPLVSWIWLGAALLMVGGVLAIWPLPDRPVVARVAEPNVDATGAGA
jgi:hypothetical protein